MTITRTSGKIIWLALLVSTLPGMNLSMAQTAEETERHDTEAHTKPQPTLEEVIVTGRFIGETGRSALKMDLPLRDVPFTVSSYTDEFMKAIETTRISDLYNYMTGVQRAGNTAYDINIRGFAAGGADRNTLLVDGLPGLAVRFGSPPTISAQRVEVVKGPASVLYGQIQPGGFINMVTKKPEAEALTTVRARSETFYGDKASVSDSLGFTISVDSTGPLTNDDKLLYRLIAEYDDNPGFRDFGKGKTKYVVPSLTWNIGSNTNITGFVEYRNEDVSWDDGLVAPNNSNGVPDARLINPDITTYYHEPGDFNAEEGVTFGLSFSRRFSDNFVWQGNFRGVDHKDHRIALDTQGTRLCHPSSVAGQLDPTAICVRRRQRDQLNKRSYYFGDTNARWDLDLGNVANTLMFGVNVGRETANFKRNDFGRNNNTYDIFLIGPIYGQGTPNPPQEHTWTLTTFDSFALYIQDRVSLGEQWKLLVGGRYEEFDILNESKRPMDHPFWTAPQNTKGNAFVPMAGLLFQPNDHWTYYVSYAESFNPPAPGRLDINGNIFTVPEKGQQYEIGIKADLVDERGTITLSGFEIEKKNSLQQVGTTGVFQLTGTEKSKGVELEADLAITAWWQIIAGYSFVDANVKDDVNVAIIGQELRNIPKHSASMWNRVQLSQAFSLGLGVNYVDKRFGTIPNSQGEAFRLLLPSYVLVDAALYYSNERHGINATLKFGNLLDKKYYPSGFSPTRINPGAPANITLSVSKAF